MNTSRAIDKIKNFKIDLRVKELTIDDEKLIVELMDGRSISAPLWWFPRLLNATVQQRANWRVIDAGYGIHWPEVDEHIGSEGLLTGRPVFIPTRPPKIVELDEKWVIANEQ
ncbi:MAG: DUF2442 domain-containing protein [Calditrichaceae bacterium]|nr:DUF2442 domain-containing protein [Calditrichia bacterium]NUQ40693.1 DUF2442 domain-containing protein [Calditrichaceae bacterium]